MYEAQTYEAILSRMLQKALSINGNLDTREGSLVWCGDAPAAVELQNLYIALDTVLNETFADTATRPYLILRAAERGLKPQPASPAVLQLSITPTTLHLPMNTRFSIGELNYYVSADRGSGKYEITCETAGEAGNDYTGTVIPIEYVDGLETCSISAVVIPGEDEEDTEVFRQRYMDSLNAQAFGGNRADYLEKVNAIPGVGGVKVYRVWNSDLNPAKLIPPTGTDTWISGLSGVSEEIKAWLDAVYAAGANSKLTVGGTVKLVIINSSFKKPSEALVDQVQTAVDPLQNAGEGVGIAPIGHVVRVEGVGEDTINLSFDLYYQREWSWDDVSAYVTEAINGYFLELAQSWADQNEALVVRISQVESRLLGITGILDIANTKINGEAANCTLTLDHIPVLGTIEPGTTDKGAGNMERKLIDYLPYVIRDYAEFQGIMGSEQPEIEKAWNTTDDLLDNQFIPTAGNMGLSRWEKILGITPKGTDSLEDRRFRILTRINEELPYTLPQLRNILETLCGKGNYSADVEEGTYQLLVKIGLAAKNNFNDVESLLNRVVPQNMVVTLLQLYNTHAELGRFTHAQLAAYTHNQLRNEVLKNGE